ncbi:hypothetical protein RCH09_003853 [Actimicrobium sp. GrIS 1.19]|uniref:PEP-CTERM sorting domain-containing protein n=1 Tax=Actimicrobium sp. GrIS 1.19 TaxID=3071708 RepID=UPI002E020E50|nr:hypothetical protein [Actimicrobium sp. GrIS 1.19]
MKTCRALILSVLLAGSSLANAAAVAVTPDVKAAPLHLEARKMSHVPEPEGWAMLVLGVGFVVYQVRRRKRSRDSWKSN